MARVRIAVCGAGLIGRAHIERVLSAPDCALAGVADPTPEAAAHCREVGAPHFPDLAALLDSAGAGGVRPDGVIVATPNVLHVPQALECIARGLPVLVEKPIAETVDGALAIAAAAEAAKVAVLVGHHRRHSPILAAARAHVGAGRLGRLVTVSASTTFLKPDGYFDMAWRRQPGGGPVLINLIHDIDDLRFVCGEIASVQAVASSAVRGFAVEDTAAVLLRFAGGALGTMTLSDTAAAPWSWELTSGENPAYPRQAEDCYLIAGTEGALAVPSLRTWRYGAARGWNAPLEAGRLAVEEADPLVRQLAHFAAVVRGEAVPLIDAREGARTLAATYAVHQASASGQAVVLAAS
ncbi:MAG: Gfo/Idh/MocA family oxidoreductase [Alphaproteobacteria bacterium]|nr:Gfo/Idh/MocA family oxidoreductase [Alphaproteobacteria bacterium]